MSSTQLLISSLINSCVLLISEFRYNTVWHTKLNVTIDAVKVLTSLCLPHLCREDRVRSDRHAVKYSGLGTIKYPYTLKAIEMQHQLMNIIKQTHFAVLSALPKRLRETKRLR